MKNVLFIGATEYSPYNLNSTQKKKFEGLSNLFSIFVLARGKQREERKMCGVSFFLVPRGFHVIWWSVKSFFTAQKICKTYNIDVVITQSPSFDGLIGVWLKKVCGVKLIVEVHGDWIEAPFLYKKRKGKKYIQKLLVWLGRKSLSTADAVRTISSFTTTLAQCYSGKKPYYTFPAFNNIDAFFAEPSRIFGETIVFVGSLYRVKGISYLINAFAQSQFLKDNRFKLIIAGSGPERKNLENQVAALGVQSSVIFTGQISREEVLSLMQECYMLVLPSLSEGLGLVIAEAMALGKPVVASNIGGIPDLIKDGETGFLCEPKNVDCLAKKMLLLLQDKERAQKMGKKGRQKVQQKFSNSAYFTAYKDMIEQI